LIKFGNAAGNSGIRLCAESSAATATEASDSSPSAGRHSHPSPLAVLRRGRELYVNRHLEAAHGTKT